MYPITGSATDTSTKPNHAHKQAHVEQQLLLPAQEKVLGNWVKYWGNEGQPMSKNMLLVTVADMSEHLQEKLKETRKRCLPDQKWVYAFMAHHPDLKLKWPTGLHPTCAQCFNPAVVKGHFELLSSFLQDNNIPWENVYNMDEKGLQLGGGRRLDGSWYLYSSEQRICVNVMTARDYDPDTFSFSLSSFTLSPQLPLLGCTITHLVVPLFSFCLFPCTFTTASPTQPGL